MEDQGSKSNGASKKKRSKSGTICSAVIYRHSTGSAAVSQNAGALECSSKLRTRATVLKKGAVSNTVHRMN